MIETRSATATPVTTCTVRQLIEWLKGLGLTEHEVGRAFLDLVREGRVRLAGPEAEWIAREMGLPQRSH